MTQDEIKSNLMKIQSVSIEKYLTDDTEEPGANPTIIIQVVDESFDYGYWDYFYKTNADNPNWYTEFEEYFNTYLSELDDIEDNTIQEIKMFMCFYDTLTDFKPYGYWDCLITEYYYE